MLTELPARKVWVHATGGRAPLNGWGAYYAARSIDADSPLALLMHFVCSLYYCVHLLLPELLERPGPILSTTEPEPEPEPEPVVAAVDGGAPWVVIHYLGPEKELDSLPLFGELGLLLPQIRIRLVMVGPEVPEEMNGQRKVYRREGVPVQPGKEYAVDGGVGQLLPGCEVTTVRCMYHELQEMAAGSKVPGLYAGDSRLTPRIVIGLNAGLSAYESFIPT